MPAAVGPAPVAKNPSDVSRPVDGSIVKGLAVVAAIVRDVQGRAVRRMTRPAGELALMAVPTWALVAASKILTVLLPWAAT
jgi:hypothetical protein